MKKLIWSIVILGIVVCLFAAWKLFGPSVHAPDGKYFYVRTGSGFDQVVSDLKKKKVINSERWFNFLAARLKYKTVKPGKYEIKKGMSLFELVRMLKNGRQKPVDLVIIKFRTKEEFAKKIGKEFETDSAEMASFLSNADSLKNYGVDTTTWACAIIPDTYRYFWNSTPTKIFSKLYTESGKFWTSEKKQQAADRNLDPCKVYTLASIIEEETNSKKDKPNIASVYLNRIEQGMPLQADPTIKFAMRDFGLKRIYQKYLDYPSPYNTYRNKGLPPGPICTPSAETIEAVLNSPKTNYVYFVANSDFSGSHIFTSSYDEHLKYAKLYQKALDAQDSIRKARQTNP
jgi:UPF0755 protein